MIEKVPRLYETENIPLEKIIHRKYELVSRGFHWLSAELDPERDLAFGYANLNDDQMAEWGYISIDELIDNHAELDREWKQCTYAEAMRRIAREKRAGRVNQKPLA